MSKIALAAAAAALALAFSMPAAASEALAKSAGCSNCHAVDAKKVGPSYKSIAEKFKGKGPDAVVAAVKAAAPHKSTKASDADIKSIADWILTQ